MNNSFEREVLDRLTKIETKIDDYKEIKRDTASALALSKENEKEITDIQDKLKWITRTVVGAIITGIIGIVILLIQMGAGIK